MASINVQLQTTGPLFLKGADPRGDPEFRVASIRGQLRYWLRAILGAETQDLSSIWKQESAIFGSTGGGSMITLRLSRNGVFRQKSKSEDEPSDPRSGRYKPFLLPHRMNERERSPEYAIRPGTRVTLTLSTRPGVRIPQRAVDALSLWLLLGGVGKRSRRMFGGFSLRDAVNVESAGSALVPDWMQSVPQDSAGWVSAYHTELGRIIRPERIAEPAFPVLHPDHCHVLVGRNRFESAVRANEHLFRDLLRKKYLDDETMFGYAGGGGRRASPLVAQARVIGDDDVFGVFTILRSPLRRQGKPTDWSILNRFAADLKDSRHYDAETVHGGPFA